MLIFLYFFIALSGFSIVSGQQRLVCTTVMFPPYGNTVGNPVPVQPIILPAGIKQYTLRYENTCRVTNSLVVKVCDDVPPFVNAVNMYQVDVTRLGNYQYVKGVAFATFYCQ